MKDHIQTVLTMLALIIGILAVIASWYSAIILVMLFATFFSAKAYVNVKKVWNGEN